MSVGSQRLQGEPWLPGSKSRAGALRISALACSDPARSYSQREVLELLGLEGDEFAERIFERSGVRRRQLALGARELAQNLQARTLTSTRPNEPGGTARHGPRGTGQRCRHRR